MDRCHAYPYCYACNPDYKSWRSFTVQNSIPEGQLDKAIKGMLKEAEEKMDTCQHTLVVSRCLDCGAEWEE